MAYTKYSLTPANNTAAPPDGAPEGMLPSAVNDTMRDMMAQIRDVGDGVRDGTYTMTAVKITGGTINGATIGATTATTGKFSTLTNSALTSGRVTYAGASGLLSDSASLTFDGTSLTTPRLVLGGTTLPSAGTATLFSRTSDNNTYLQTGSGNNFNLLDGSQNTMATFSPTALNFNISNTAKLTLNSTTLYTASGVNVGIGTSSPGSPLTVSTTGVDRTVQINSTDGAGGYGAVLSLNNTGTGGREYNITSTSNADGGVGGGKLKFYDVTAASTRMMIDASGRLLINSPSFTEGMVSIKCNTSSSGISIGVLTNGDNAVNFYNASNTYVSSIVVNSGTVAYNTSSDYRLKENIAPMTGALGVVQALKPVTYNWKSDGSDGQGFIAHELQAIVPEAVTGEKDAVDADGNPKYQGVDTSFLVATLTKAIQEQQALIESLTTRLTALENK